MDTQSIINAAHEQYCQEHLKRMDMLECERRSFFATEEGRDERNEAMETEELSYEEESKLQAAGWQWQRSD